MLTLHLTAARRTIRNISLTLGMFLIATPIVTPAQTQTALTQTPESSPATLESDRQWLRVSAQRVNLRSRADLNSRIVGRVNRDDVLECHEVLPGWRKIVPPPGVYSLVSAQYVERTGPTRGIIKVDNTLRIRVGSDVQPRDPMLSEVQTRLKHDDQVEILGEYEGGWLKIVPPEGVYVYIAADYVERATPEVARDLHQTKPPTTAPETETASFASDAPDLSGPWGLRMAHLLTAIEEELQESADEQNWNPLLTLLKPVAEQNAEPQVAQLAQSWTGKSTTKSNNTPRQNNKRPAGRVNSSRPASKIRLPVLVPPLTHAASCSPASPCRSAPTGCATNFKIP